ncbi:hypothetical protein EJB05_21867, partial [Eragrostis curvula]
MASNAKIAVVVAIVALLQVSCIAVARRNGKAGPCADDAEGCLDHLAASRHGHGDGGGIPAVMTVNGFQKGEEGGRSECDGAFHNDHERLVALSTRWYASGHRCHKKIRITSVKNGRSVDATVVDECDSRRGCKDNIVDASKAVWEALGLDTNIGEVPVTWSDA